MVLYYQKDQQSVKCIPLPTSNDGFSLLRNIFDVAYGESIFDTDGPKCIPLPTSNRVLAKRACFKI